MNSTDAKLVSEYDQAYHQPHFFHHKLSVQRPFINSLVNKAKLSRNASVLDAGCGQGFFTGLFAELGFKAVGVDLSPQGILSAQNAYASCGAKFEVGDVSSLPYDQAFDCVFARCFS